MVDKIPAGVKDQKVATYSIVPGEVVYNPQFHDGMVRVYAAISGLCGSKGYCDASNAWFSWKLHKTPWTISKIIKKLEESGHIVTMIVKPQGNKRFILCITDKFLNLLAQATVIKGSESLAELLSSKAIALLSLKATPIAVDDNPPIVVDDNHRIVKEEEGGEEEKKAPLTLFRKGSKEDVAQQAYLAVKEKHYLAFDDDFFDFFEEEVLGRFSKQEVSIATLNDWYHDIWKVYEIDSVVRFLKQQKTETNAWQVKWMQLINRLKAEATRKKNLAARLARDAAEAKPEEKETRTLHEIDMEWLRDDPDGFMGKYEGNQFFRTRMDKDPEIKKQVDKILQKRKKA